MSIASMCTTSTTQSLNWALFRSPSFLRDYGVRLNFLKEVELMPKYDFMASPPGMGFACYRRQRSIILFFGSMHWLVRLVVKNTDFVLSSFPSTWVCRKH